MWQSGQPDGQVCTYVKHDTPFSDADCSITGKVICEWSQPCEPACNGKQCGELDGCGGLCTDCPAGSVCSTNYTCQTADVACPDGYAVLRLEEEAPYTIVCFRIYGGASCACTLRHPV